MAKYTFEDEKIELNPFWKDFKNYKIKFFRNDLRAAFYISLISIPQSIAYSILAGLPLSAGIFSAIFGVMIASIFCSSKHLIAGPSTGISILLQSSIANIISTYDLTNIGSKDEIVSYILTMMMIMIAIIQIISAFLQVGKLIYFISRAVILGYFVGVSVAIIINQLFLLFDIKENAALFSIFNKMTYLITNITNINMISLFVGIISICLIIFIKKVFKEKLPEMLLMIIISSIICYFINKFDYSISTLQITSSKLQFKWIKFTMDFHLLNTIFLYSLAICLLSILEIFSVSRGFATKANRKINYSQEIFGVGVSNFFLSFLTYSIPSSASISKTTINYIKKNNTRFAAFFSSIIVLFFYYLALPLLRYIPLCAIASMLIIFSISLIKIEDIKICFLINKEDGVVFCLTLLFCIFFNLITAFFMGIIMSLLLFLKKISNLHLNEYAFNKAGKLINVSSKKKHSKIKIIGVNGELFFGVIDILQNKIYKMAQDDFVKVIILRFHGVRYLDASTCFALEKLQEHLYSNKRHLILSGISEDIWKVFKSAKLVEKIGHNNIFLSNEAFPHVSTWRASLRAQELLYK